MWFQGPESLLSLLYTAPTRGNDFGPTAHEATEQNKRENICLKYDKGQDQVWGKTLFKENTAKS